jgi:hypothetical protein
VQRSNSLPRIIENDPAPEEEEPLPLPQQTGTSLAGPQESAPPLALESASVQQNGVVAEDSATAEVGRSLAYGVLDQVVRQIFANLPVGRKDSMSGFDKRDPQGKRLCRIVFCVVCQPCRQCQFRISLFQSEPPVLGSSTSQAIQEVRRLPHKTHLYAQKRSSLGHVQVRVQLSRSSKTQSRFWSQIGSSA